MTEQKIKVAHTVNYAPGLSGMYNSVRDLVMEERRLGAEAEVIDDVASPLAKGTDGIVPVPTSYGDSADIICWHHAIAESWLNEPHRNLVLFLHGTPEFNFFTEMHESDRVLSLLIGAATKNIAKGYVTMWKRHVPYWESMFQRKVHYIPAWVNLSEWQLSEKPVDPGTIKIAMVDFWRLTREPFGLIAAIDQLRKNTNKKIEVNVWGLLDWPNDTYKAVIQWLVESNVMVLRGNTRDPMRDIYHQNDLVISMSTEETRVVRESFACGVPVVCGRGPLHFNKYSGDCIDAEKFAELINQCHEDLVRSTDVTRLELREYAEKNFDIRDGGRTVLGIFESILEEHGSVNRPKIRGSVRPVASVDDTCDKLYERLSTNKATCFLRFGDGDLILMNGQDGESLHKHSPELQNELIESFQHKEDGYLVASVAGQMNEGRMQKGLFAAPEYNDQLMEIVDRFRPDETLENANALAYKSVFEPAWFMDFLNKCVRNKRVLFIGGEQLCQSPLVGRVFNVARFFPLPMRDAYYTLTEKIEEIKLLTSEFDMIVCAAGMATRVLAKRLWTQGFRINFLDIGSIADALAGITSRTWLRMLSDDYVQNFRNVFTPSRTDIIVLTYNNEEKTIACFESIKKHTENYRVIWVDNGSTPESIAAVKEAAKGLADCDLISVSTNEGFSKGVNRGLRRFIADGSASYVVLLNNDTVVTKGWLESLITAQLTSNFDALSPLSSEGTPHAVTAFETAVPKMPKFSADTPSEEKAAELKSVFGSESIMVSSEMSFFCMLLKRDTVEQVGLLDENLFAYGEDNDYCWRMSLMGKKFGISLGTYVQHDHRSTSSKMGDGWRAAQSSKALKYLAKKWAPERVKEAVGHVKKLATCRA